MFKSLLEEKMHQGKLRIYFGYAAGVGKTYAMLQGAQEAKANGIEVVLGYIEPHARPETSQLALGFESISAKEMTYRGLRFSEFDLDATLRRKPQLVLVDELAHNNVTGSRNKKRFQDIEELLRAGIDVYTTLNVQHIESLMDQVQQITDIQVNERIPDYVFNEADQIKLVDIEPDDLLERLHKGKIYNKVQAERALNNFFTLEKLFALREIALLKTADQVNNLANKQQVDAKVGFAKEQILVCVSSSPSSPIVIRAAVRLAAAFKAELTALYVSEEGDESLSHEERKSLRQNLRLAEQLGAKVSVVYGTGLAEQISEYAKTSHITKLVIGKTPEKRNFGGVSFIDKLGQLAPELDIYIIPYTKAGYQNFSRIRRFPTIHFTFSDLFKTIMVLFACTLVGLIFDYWKFNVSNIITIYILGVQINAVITRGRIFSVISSVLSVLCFNYFFTVPYFSFEVFNNSYPVTFAIMLTAGLITSTLIKRIQNQVKMNAEKSYRTELLLQANKDLQIPESVPEILSATARSLTHLLEKDVVVYPVENEVLQNAVFFPATQSNQTLETYQRLKENGVADWVLHNNKRAGATTNTLSASKYLYLSVRLKNRIFAIIGVSMLDGIEIEPFEKSVFLSILGEAGLALEKEVLRSEQQQTVIEMKQEQLRANLLRAISHDLRSPLTSISGNAKLLMENHNSFNEPRKLELYSYIYDDSMWLISLIENLLAVTKLESNVALNLQVNSIEEAITEALKHVDRHINEHQLKTILSDEVLFAKMDSALIVQVIINIVNNAIKYTPKGSTITLMAERLKNSIQVEIADDGEGISDVAKTKIFDLFYTADKNPDSKRGLGIGLSLCKTIINSHSGEIYVKDNKPKGTIIGFNLPLVEVDINGWKS